MSSERLTRNFILLRALRWLPVGLVLPFLILTPVARGLDLGAVGLVFAVHSAVLIVLEVPSGALADTFGRRRVLLVGAALTAASLATFAVAQSVLAFMASVAALGTGRALISGALEAWYVDSLRALDPGAPLARGLSRGTAAEAIALGLGALLGGALVSLADPSEVADGALAGYGLAALVGAAAALVYLAAVAALVHEPAHEAHIQDAGHSAARRIRMVFATAQGRDRRVDHRPRDLRDGGGVRIRNERGRASVAAASRGGDRWRHAPRLRVRGGRSGIDARGGDRRRPQPEAAREPGAAARLPRHPWARGRDHRPARRSPTRRSPSSRCTSRPT